MAEVVPQRLKNALIETQAPDAHKLNNQYARAQGQVDLVRELALLYGPLYGRTIDAMTEVSSLTLFEIRIFPREL